MKRQLNAMKELLHQTIDNSVIDKVVVSQLKTIIVANRTMQRTKDLKNEWRPLLLEAMAGKENAYEAAKTVIETAYPDFFSTILKKYPDFDVSLDDVNQIFNVVDISRSLYVH